MAAQFFTLSTDAMGVRKAKPIDNEDIDIEMANLTEDYTGVAGVIHVSTYDPRHGPRVKWYQDRPQSRTSGYIAISIGDPPKPVKKTIKNYSEEDYQRACKWVAKNRKALRDFWDNGFNWTPIQVNAFISGLKSV